MDTWPAIPLEDWQDTQLSLQLRLQVVGKVRLACSPWLNHSWHATLYVTPRGLTTGTIPYGPRTFEIQLDLIDHELGVRSSDGRSAVLPLRPEPMSSFYRGLMEALAGLDIQVRIHMRPNEMEEAVRFDEDHRDRPYDADAVHRFRRALVQADRVMNQFRARFIGKSSPVHLFWGAADLAVTRFSGRSAPVHPGGLPHLPDWITREAYSHEVSSCGFWAGGGPVPYPRSTPTPTRSRRASRPRPSCRKRRSTAPTSASSSFRTTRSGPRPGRTRRCSASFRARTTPRPTWAAGTAARSSGTRRPAGRWSPGRSAPTRVEGSPGPAAEP